MLWAGGNFKAELLAALPPVHAQGPWWDVPGEQPQHLREHRTCTWANASTLSGHRCSCRILMLLANVIPGSVVMLLRLWASRAEVHSTAARLATFSIHRDFSTCWQGKLRGISVFFYRSDVHSNPTFLTICVYSTGNAYPSKLNKASTQA